MLTLMMNEVPEMVARKASIIELGVAPFDHIAVARLIERIGIGERLAGFDWERDAGWLRASDGSTTISANEFSGGLRYRLRPLAEEPGTEVSASSSRLEQIARDFLDRMGRPADPQALDTITYLHTEAVKPGGEITERATLDAGLIFKRTVDELPVIGPGGMVMVKIGTDETVVGGREVWRPITTRGAPVSLRTPDEAADMLKRRLRRLGLDGEIRVRHASLGYAELGIERQQRYLEPCYAYEIVIGSTVQSKKIEVIPAARVGPMAEAFARV